MEVERAGREYDDVHIPAGRLATPTYIHSCTNRYIDAYIDA
jgi:hypothetical protein